MYGRQYRVVGYEDDFTRKALGRGSERCFGLISAAGVRDGALGDTWSAIEASGLRVARAKMVHLTQASVDQSSLSAYRCDRAARPPREQADVPAVASGMADPSIATAGLIVVFEVRRARRDSELPRPPFMTLLAPTAAPRGGPRRRVEQRLQPRPGRLHGPRAPRARRAAAPGLLWARRRPRRLGRRGAGRPLGLLVRPHPPVDGRGGCAAWPGRERPASALLHALSPPPLFRQRGGRADRAQPLRGCVGIIRRRRRCGRQQRRRPRHHGAGDVRLHARPGRATEGQRAGC